MKLDSVLKLGDPVLYEHSLAVSREECMALKPLITDLHDILVEFRSIYGAGRAIAAPQIGVLKRLIYLNIDRPVVIINPILSDLSSEMFEVWDDCLCFPQLLVKVKRHKTGILNFVDENWEKHTWNLAGDLSELIQHEYDHLEGILAVQRAIDNKSFAWRK